MQTNPLPNDGLHKHRMPWIFPHRLLFLIGLLIIILLIPGKVRAQDDTEEDDSNDLEMFVCNLSGIVILSYLLFHYCYKRENPHRLEDFLKLIEIIRRKPALLIAFIFPIYLLSTVEVSSPIETMYELTQMVCVGMIPITVLFLLVFYEQNYERKKREKLRRNAILRAKRTSQPPFSDVEYTEAIYVDGEARSGDLSESGYDSSRYEEY